MNAAWNPLAEIQGQDNPAVKHRIGPPITAFIPADDQPKPTEDGGLSRRRAVRGKATARELGRPTDRPLRPCRVE